MYYHDFLSTIFLIIQIKTLLIIVYQFKKYWLASGLESGC